MANWPDRALTSYGLAGRITGAAVSSVCSPRVRRASVRPRGSGTGPALTGVIDQGRGSKVAKWGCD